MTISRIPSALERSFTKALEKQRQKDREALEWEKVIGLLSFNNEVGERCFCFARATQEVLDQLQKDVSKGDVDSGAYNLDILRQGKGTPTQADMEFMKREYDYMPPHKGRDR